MNHEAEGAKNPTKKAVSGHQPTSASLVGLAGLRPIEKVALGMLAGGMIGSLLPWTPPWAALLGGVVLAFAVGNPWVKQTGGCAKWLLQVSVVGLGAGVNLGVAARVGAQGFGYTIAGIALTFAVGVWLAGRLKVAPKVGALVCAGTAICGGSAIAAAAPAIDADPAETSASLATVFILNAVALLIFPPIGAWAELDPHAFGLWCALAIHDTSSVTGAALTRGPEALVTATTVKLARALWIMPVALLLGFWFSRRAQASGPAKKKFQIPWFIGGFVAVSAFFTLLPALKPVANTVSTITHSILKLTLFLIGADLSADVVKAVGPRPFLHGLVLWFVVGGATLGAIMLGWIR